MNRVYQLTCPNCHMKYIGQTGHPFHIWSRQHYRDNKYANNKTKFAQHVLEAGHSFDPMVDGTDVLRLAKKGIMLDTLERFYSYRETRLGN
jgi:hypothetical protein